MKINIGPITNLYPTPITIIGTEGNGRVNWVCTSQIGHVGDKHMIVSLSKKHFSNEAILEHMCFSINVVTQDYLIEIDFINSVSGRYVDKSKLFEYEKKQLLNAPLIIDSSLSMECVVKDIYETEGFYNYIVQPVSTYIDSSLINDLGQIEFFKTHPIFYENTSNKYYQLSDFLGHQIK